MNRRHFIKLAGLTSVMTTLPAAFTLRAAPTDFSGKFLVTVQAEGGWDVTSFCDPKMNLPGEDQINHWAINDETREAGNIRYAPFGNNQAFFEKYHRDMLIINGIDVQTNSHTAGVTHNFSGRIAEGFPTLSALHAAHSAPDLPIAYINNGGYAETAGIIRHTRLDNVHQLRNIVAPNTTEWNPDEKWLPTADWALIEQTRNTRMAAQLQRQELTLRQRLALGGYKSALDNASVLNDFLHTLQNTGGLSEIEQGANFYSSFKRQSELALIAMKSGVSVAADLNVGGFDTHQNHDIEQGALMAHVTDSIDHFWTFAEQLGIAERIVMVVMSDFGRTPHYNDTNGKDHWPISSAMVMERGAPWGNRMVGATDGGHNVMAIDPLSLQPDSSNNGKIIYPKHVMQSLREYLGVADQAVAAPFQFNNGENFDFFNAAKSTPQ